MKADVLPLTGYNALNIKQAGYSKLAAGNESHKRELARKMHRCFVQTDAGKEVLEILKAWTLTRPVSPPGCQNGYPFFREGQNDIVRSILEAIEDAENE